MFPFDRRLRRGTFLDPLLSGGRAQLVNVRTGETVATTIEPALDAKTRGKGLLGRMYLDRGTAMIIAPSSSVHMFFMKFALDVVFVKADGRVVKVVRNLKPWRMAAAFGALAAIEFAAGAASGISEGDVLTITDGYRSP